MGPPDRDDELADCKADGDLILASMKSRGAGKWNAKDLLTAAKELTDCLNDMVDKTRNKEDLLDNWDDILGLLEQEASVRKSKQRKDPNDLLDLIYNQEAEKKRREEEERKKREEEERKRLEEEKRKKEEEERKRKAKEELKKKRLAQQKKRQAEIDKLEKEKQEALNAKSKLKKTHAPGSLGEKIGSLADDIEDSVRQKRGINVENEPAIKSTMAIANNLAKLAESAEKRDKQGVIQAGRDVSANIKKLCKQLKQLANKCPDRKVREEMLRDAMALNNFAIQLKIVASVSAANLDQKGGHERLVTMATSMTKSVMGCVEQVAVAKIKIGN